MLWVASRMLLTASAESVSAKDFEGAKLSVRSVPASMDWSALM